MTVEVGQTSFGRALGEAASSPPGTRAQGKGASLRCRVGQVLGRSPKANLGMPVAVAEPFEPDKVDVKAAASGTGVLRCRAGRRGAVVLPV